MTKPSYEELRNRQIAMCDELAELVSTHRSDFCWQDSLQDVRNLKASLAEMTEKYKAEYGYVESAREERDQIAKTCDLLRAENLRVRGLLQRVSDIACGLSCGGDSDDALAEIKRLTTQAAESADIGKLDTADRSGVEMGKVNRVEEAPACRCCSFWQGKRSACTSRELSAGSAEAGGEKAAPEYGTAEYFARQTGELLATKPYSDRAFEIALEIRRAGANFPHPSQNQTVTSGVEGAQEGTTADESGSREPEKLNNAQKAAADEPHHRNCGLLHGDTVCNCSLWHALCDIQDYIVCEEETPERKLYVVGNELIERVKQNFALAESSLSSPPPPRGFCIGSRCRGCAQCQ